MSLSDVCDSFSLYLWLYVCPKVDPLADQMLYMYGSTHFPVTLSPSRLLTTKRLTCAESSHKRWGLVKGIPRQPFPCLFCEVADPYPASSVAYRSLNKRKKEKNATFPFVSDILKVSSLPTTLEYAGFAVQMHGVEISEGSLFCHQN